MAAPIIDNERLERMVAEVRTKVRMIVYERRNWYHGTDVCKVLGLAPSPSRKSYQSLFCRLFSSERMTLPDNFGGRGHNRVMVDLSGIYTLASIALERETTAAIRESCLRRHREAERQSARMLSASAPAGVSPF